MQQIPIRALVPESFALVPEGVDDVPRQVPLLLPHHLRIPVFEYRTVEYEGFVTFDRRVVVTEMCSGSEAGSYLRLIDFVYHSTLGLRVMKKKRRGRTGRCSCCSAFLFLISLKPRVE